MSALQRARRFAGGARDAAPAAGPKEAAAIRRLAAGVLDAALLAGIAKASGGRSSRVARGMTMTGELIREQVGSPGERLLGLRTVDRRTGLPVAPWRSLLIAAAGAGGQALVARIAPPTQTHPVENGDLLHEVDSIHRRFGQDVEARREALAQAYATHSEGAPQLARTVLPIIAVGVATSRLRRRLAPTRQIRAGEDG